VFPFVAALTPVEYATYTEFKAGSTGGRGSFTKVSTKTEGVEMNFIIWIVIGGIIGWLASLVMKTDAQQGLFLNVVVGIVGALLGGWLLSPLFGAGTINADNFSIMSLVVSFLGAVILLAIVNLIFRGRVR
jgi:uncharacterized membrane protein YeaQ/YmgE (transglycosylase-associated protein family)